MSAQFSGVGRRLVFFRRLSGRIVGIAPATRFDLSFDMLGVLLAGPDFARAISDRGLRPLSIGYCLRSKRVAGRPRDGVKSVVYGVARFLP